jgi:hypothetical protein
VLALGLALFVVVAVIALRPGRASTATGSEVDDLWGDPAAFGPLTQLPSWSQPIALALLFALVSFPLVAMTLGVIEGNQPATPLGPWPAASAVFPAALVASALGGHTIKSRPLIGGLFTFFAALIVAIAFVPLLPALLGQNIYAGCVSLTSGPCGSYVVDSTIPASGLSAALLFILAPLSEPLPVLILAVGVSLWTYLVRHLPDV